MTSQVKLKALQQQHLAYAAEKQQQDIRTAQLETGLKESEEGRLELETILQEVRAVDNEEITR